MKIGPNCAHNFNKINFVDSEALLSGIEQNRPEETEYLYTIIRRATFGALRGSNLAHAEDLAHDAFLTVLNAVRIGQIRTASAFVAFTLGVVRNVRLRYFCDNARSGRSDSSALHSLPDHRKQFDAAIEQQDTVAAIREAVVCLPPHYRPIIEDFYFSAMSPEEIRARHELTETQFRLIKSRAIGKLRKQVQSHGPLRKFHTA